MVTTATKVMNGLLTRLFSLLLWPFQTLDPFWGIVFVSLLTGFFMLWIFGKVSNQEAIRHIKKRIWGNLLAIRLYQHDVKVMLNLQARILRDTLRYMKYSFVPLLVILPPVLLIIIQLDLHFSLATLEPGRPVVVKAKVNDLSWLDKSVSLEAPPEIEVETPGVRISSLNEIAWRIRAQQPGRYSLRVRCGDQQVEKELLVDSVGRGVSGMRTSKFPQTLLFPGEDPIDPSTAIESIEITYPRLKLTCLGWEIHWLLLFFTFSIVFGFSFRSLLRVQI